MNRHNHAELNNACAKAFGAVASYAPLTTENLIEEVSKQTLQEFEEGEGRDALVIAEAQVIEVSCCFLPTQACLWAPAFLTLSCA
jgi:hypothetical protein